MGDKRATYFLKLFSSNFSLQFLMSLDLIYEELSLPIQQLEDFHQAVLDVISQQPLLQKTYPKYTKKFLEWCSKPHLKREYKGKNYDQYKSRVESTQTQFGLTKQEQTRKRVKLPENSKKLESEVGHLQLEIKKRDEFIKNLLSTIFHPQSISILNTEIF